jgi:hypothetical protein
MAFWLCVLWMELRVLYCSGEMKLVSKMGKWCGGN